MARPTTPQAIRGTQDMAFEQAERFHHVVDAFDRVRRLYGFGRIEVPVFEATAVFARSLGETTDVVSKEMYSFEDRGGDPLTLRPEFTAGIARAYLTNGWAQHAPMKVATHGPLFRYERPQKGRFRQFHQLDAEVIGAAEPAADVELLAFADQLLHELGVADGVTLQLNTLGDTATRDAWRAALVAHFEAARDALSEDSVARLAKNPLRILDSKDPSDRPVAEAAPGIDAFMSAEAGDFFDKVKRGLEAAGVKWVPNPHLVRGLDYYRHTAFEFVTDRLGSQGTVLGGGRYDGLIETLGGPHTPAVGWAAGIERLAMLIEAPSAKRPWAIVVEDDDFRLEAFKLAQAMRLGTGQTQELRSDRPAILLFDQGSRKKRFDRAVTAKAQQIVVIDRSISGGLFDIRVRSSEGAGEFFWNAADSVFEYKVVGSVHDAREAIVLAVRA